MTLFLLSGFSQNSEDLIPKDALIVFSIHDFSEIKELPLNELMSYAFMSELEQEQYDGSTHKKKIKDAGLNLNQKMSVFSGKTNNYSISGVTFGLSNKEKLFEVFDDFDDEESIYEGYELYSSYFNKLFIKSGCALLIRLECNEQKINELTDSIWNAKGYLNKLKDDNVKNDTKNTFDWVESNEFEELEEKGYLELRDSVQLALHDKYEKIIIDELIIDGKNLIKSDKNFEEQINHQTDGSVYFDNSRNAMGIWNKYNFSKNAFGEIESIYKNSKTVGDLSFVNNGLELNLTSSYSEKMGLVYSELNKTKLNKSIRNYIPQDMAAFFIYKINLEAAYEKMVETLLPILRKQTNIKITRGVIMFDILNEFINKEALFKAYQGSVFATFNGTEKIKTDKIEHEYNEETFEYTEVISKKEELMPLFTIGVCSENKNLLSKIFNSVSKLDPLLKKKDNYWRYEDAIMSAAPLYFFHEKNIFFITNDSKMIHDNRNGYEKPLISKKEIRDINNGGAIYFKSNLEQSISQIPSSLFPSKEAEFISFIKNGHGNVQFLSNLTKDNQTRYKLIYNCDENKKNKGVHLLDLINAIYLFTNN